MSLGARNGLPSHSEDAAPRIFPLGSMRQIALLFDAQTRCVPSGRILWPLKPAEESRTQSVNWPAFEDRAFRERRASGNLYGFRRGSHQQKQQKRSSHGALRNSSNTAGPGQLISA